MARYSTTFYKTKTRGRKPRGRTAKALYFICHSGKPDVGPFYSHGQASYIKKKGVPGVIKRKVYMKGY